MPTLLQYQRVTAFIFLMSKKPVTRRKSCRASPISSLKRKVWYSGGLPTYKSGDSTSVKPFNPFQRISSMLQTAFTAFLFMPLLTWYTTGCTRTIMGSIRSAQSSHSPLIECFSVFNAKSASFQL